MAVFHYNFLQLCTLSMHSKITFLTLATALASLIVTEVCLGIWDSKEANKIPAYSRNHLLKLSSLNVPSCVIDVFVPKQHELSLKEDGQDRRFDKVGKVYSKLQN